MTTHERLRRYYPFDDNILDRIANVAERQNTQDFTELAKEFGIENGPERIHPVGATKPIEVLTLEPKEDYDTSHSSVYHLAVATAIDNNRIMHAIRWFAADPSEKLIIFGNAAGPGRGAGKVALREAFQAGRNADLRSYAEPSVRYLQQQGITSVSQVGYSYGADKALKAATIGPEFDVATRDGVFIESAAEARRNLLKLAAAFVSTGGQLQKYIDQSESPVYSEIRSRQPILGLARLAVGMARPSNLAAEYVLSRGGLEERLDTLASEQPEAHITVGWGSASELVDDISMTNLVDRLRQERAHIRALRLEGMHHAGDDDIDLHAAMALQGLRLETV